MLNRNKILLVAIALIPGVFAIAQGSNDAIVADEGMMRSEGKIYVVLAIVLTILTGLFLYLVRLDRKISKLEKGDL